MPWWAITSVMITASLGGMTYRAIADRRGTHPTESQGSTE